MFSLKVYHLFVKEVSCLKRNWTLNTEQFFFQASRNVLNNMFLGRDKFLPMNGSNA